MSYENEMSDLSDRQIADKALGGRFIDHEYYAELLRRGLSGPGMRKDDTYRLIVEREQRSIERLCRYTCPYGRP